MTETEILNLPRKAIPGWEGFYEVTECGSVISLARSVPKSNSADQKRKIRVLKPNYSTDYPRIELHRRGKKRKFMVHKLTALAWLPNPENKPQLNHKDGNKLNPHVSNLEWTTQSENMKHSFHILKRDHLRIHSKRGTL